MHLALTNLKAAHCSRAYIDGSFVTTKPNPSDYDMCWSIAGVDPTLLDPVLLNFDPGRAAMRAKYGGDIFPADFQESTTGKTFLDFFQVDKLSGSPKGIIELDVRGLA
ncbi:MAG: hypothetical protein JNM79_17180 [Burkholderiales bacterium]|nr:hypothetical protein [Burkholderiales bacterium]